MLEAVEEKYEYEVMSLVDEKMEKYWEHNIQLVKNDLMEVLQDLFIHRIVNRKLFASGKLFFYPSFSRLPLFFISKNKFPEEQFAEIMKNVIGRQHFEDSIYKIFPKKALQLLEIQAISRPSNSKIIAEICAPLVGTEELATEYSLFQVEPFGTISHGRFILPVLPSRYFAVDFETNETLAVVDYKSSCKFIGTEAFCPQLTIQRSLSSWNIRKSLSHYLSSLNHRKKNPCLGPSLKYYRKTSPYC